LIALRLWAASSSRIRFVPEIKRAQTFGSFRQPPTASPAEARARQWIKIREVETALRRVGIFVLDEQAKALGLPRTTTWKILTGNSDPSAATINRILCAPRLPLPVRIKILEYVQERVSGVYGHSKSQSRRFSIRVGWTRTHGDVGRTVHNLIPRVINRSGNLDAANCNKCSSHS
jgi:hypothetical protein